MKILNQLVCRPCPICHVRISKDGYYQVNERGFTQFNCEAHLAERFLLALKTLEPVSVEQQPIHAPGVPTSEAEARHLPM